MPQEMIDPLEASRLTAAVVAIPLGSGESDAKQVVGEDELAGGKLSNAVAASADVADAQNYRDAKVTNNLQVTKTMTGNEEAVIAKNQSLEKSLDNATESETYNKPTPFVATVSSTIEPAKMELPPQTTSPAIAAVVTTTPILRTREPADNSDAVTDNTERTPTSEYINQGNNLLVLVALAGLCCIFLFVWGRKRRLSATSSSGKPSGACSTVQYMQVPKEQPLSHGQDDDDEYCDDYEEDSFASDRDDWDDWEGNSTQTQLNPFAAAPSAPRPTTPRQNNYSPIKPTQTPPPSAQQCVQLQAVTDKDDALISSIESDSSSDSFEVVTDEVHAPSTSSCSAAAETKKESESVDDLFSQFGMVPRFKKSAVVLPPPAVSDAIPLSQAEATTADSSSLPTAAEASALFAAEMNDELTAVDAADGWGEDDEWVKGI